MTPSERSLRGALLAFYEDDIEALEARIVADAKIENKSEYQDTRFRVMKLLCEELKKGNTGNGEDTG